MLDQHVLEAASRADEREPLLTGGLDRGLGRGGDRGTGSRVR